MFLIRVLPIIYSLFLLSACGGGGGGGGSSPGKNSHSSAIQSSSSVASSQAAVVWKDSGAFENDPLILREQDETGAQNIERLKANGESLSLTQKMPLRGRIAKIKISPDGTKVAYLADQETDNVYELFVSNSDGSVNLKVSAAITEGDITDFSWSDDSNYIIYVQGSGISGDTGSYIAKFDGTKSSKITYKSTAGQSLDFLAWPKFVRGTNHYQFIVGDATEQRMVRVNPLTGETFTDVRLDDKPNGGDISPNGKYLITQTAGTSQQQLYITDLSNNQTAEIYSGTRVNYYWSTLGSKVALFNASNLTIYDAEDKSSLQLMNFEYGEINGISFKDFWHNNDAHLVFETSGRLYDLLTVPTNGATPIRFREFLPPTELITYHDVSSDGNLVVFTDNHRVLTMNLDGSRLEDHTWLQPEDGLTNGMWLPDNKSVLARRYDINTNKNVLTKIDFEKKTLTSLSGNKAVNCFLVAKSAKPYCILFFDER